MIGIIIVASAEAKLLHKNLNVMHGVDATNGEKHCERHSQRTALSFSYEYWFPFEPENPPPKPFSLQLHIKLCFFLYFTLDQYNSDLLACFLIYNSIDFDDGNATYNSNQYTNHMQCNYMFSRMNNTVTYLQ